jgi:hypothetical protein
MAVTLQRDAINRGHLHVGTDDVDFVVRLGSAKKPTLSSRAEAALAASLSGRPVAGPRSGNAWVVRWRVRETVQQPSWVHTDSDVQAEFGRFLNHLGAPIGPASHVALHTAMEAVSILWQLRSGALDLAPDDRRPVTRWRSPWASWQPWRSLPGASYGKRRVGSLARPTCSLRNSLSRQASTVAPRLLSVPALGERTVPIPPLPRLPDID